MSDPSPTASARACLVTGGSGGLGAHMVRQFAAAGHPVYFTYLQNEDDARSLAAAVEADGGRCRALRADIRSESDIAQVVAAMAADGNTPAILVNNAGVSHDGMSWKLSATQWRETYDVNVTGAFLAARAVLPAMRERRHGRIINISSVVGHRGIAGTSAYAASKAALGGMTRAMAAEVASRGITVNCLVLGYFDAGMGRQLPDAVREQTLRSIPVGHFGDAGKLARIVAFLASDDCDYLTGQEITIDGGFLG